MPRPIVATVRAVLCLTAVLAASSVAPTVNDALAGVAPTAVPVAVAGAGTQLVLDLVGVFVFGLSGGVLAVSKGFDLFGVLVLAGAAALGGGALRDVIIGTVPPAGLSDPRLLAAALAAGLVTFVWHPRVARVEPVVVVLDAAGLGAFCVAGTLKALTVGAAPSAAVIVGVLTGVGGGILRDVLAGEVPQILNRGELYATPALLGCALVAAVDEFRATTAWTAPAVAALVFGVRLLALRRGWTAPRPRRAPTG
jgi:uncharacterized membrane protein YeiH